MVVKGHIENGMVVIDEPVNLREGEVVDISVPAREPQLPSLKDEVDPNLPTLAEIFKDIIGKAEGLPPDSSINHDHYLYGTPKR